MSGDGMTSDYIDLGAGIDTLKFTKASDKDTVTLTSTTITGAKSITYQTAVTAPAITTGAGADVVVFEDALSGSGVINTHSGNDSIQFLKSVGLSIADLGAGADSIYGADVISSGSISGAAGADTFLISTLSNAAIYGGSNADSINISGSLYGATVDFGDGNEQFTLTVGSSASNVQGGTGNDTLVVNTADLLSIHLVGGAGNDSVALGRRFRAARFLAVLVKTP